MSSELDPQPQWYYARDGQRAGPVGQAVLCQWLTSGQVPAATLVWHEANQAWVEARAVPAFRAAIEERPASSVPPPPPPPPQPSVVESANGSGESPTAPKPSWHRRKSVRWAVPLAACAAIAAGVAVKSQILPQWASAALPAAAPAALPVVAASAPAPAPAKPAKPNEPPTLRIKISAVPTQLPAPKPMATPAGGQPSAAAKPLVPLPSLDDLSRRRAAIGRWVAMGKPVGPQHHRARTTLALLADGRFDQRVDVCDATGAVVAGQSWQCRGTWAVREGKLVQDVTFTTNGNYPAGRWTFEVQTAGDRLALSRVETPPGYAYATRKAAYTYTRVDAK